MDTLHDQLKNLLIFINQNSKFDVFAVEMKYYKYEDYEILIPRLYGSEIRKTKQEHGISERNQKYLEFFSNLVKRFQEKHSDITISSQPSSWLSFKSIKGIKFNTAFLAGNRVGVQLEIETGNKIKNEKIFDELYKFKEQIDKEIAELEWEKREDQQRCMISLIRTRKDNIQEMSNEEREEIMLWILEKMDRFIEIFPQYISKIDFSKIN